MKHNVAVDTERRNEIHYAPGSRNDHWVFTWLHHGETDMTDDRELLELAAKAGNLPLHWDGKSGMWGPQGYWNPLTDDGDALRLAVKLRLDLQFGTFIYCGSPNIKEAGRDDMLAATRRAIVRAAAEIGRSMK